jgi:hypothetical protein
MNEEERDEEEREVVEGKGNTEMRFLREDL